MAVKVRLRRTGSNKNPFYRIVATDERFSTSGRFLENLGWYDPKKKKGPKFQVDLARVKYWKDCGAIVSDTVRSLLRKAKPEAAAPAPAPAAPVETPPVQG